jgi:predicted nucleic acid-binding protein
VRSESPGSGVVSLDWVEHHIPDPENVGRVEREPPTVGKGEKETIALGLELSCSIVLDDKKARLRARRAGLEVTGTLGILLRLHRIGLTSRGIDEDLRLLEEAGTRLSPNLRRMVIEVGKQEDGR